MRSKNKTKQVIVRTNFPRVWPRPATEAWVIQVITGACPFLWQTTVITFSGFAIYYKPGLQFRQSSALCYQAILQTTLKHKSKESLKAQKISPSQARKPQILEAWQFQKYVKIFQNTCRQALFPALFDGYVYLRWDLIGSFECEIVLWLVNIITFMLSFSILAKLKGEFFTYLWTLFV